MKNKYELSVIIPTYNRCELLSYSLESFCKQSVSKDLFEVIIVDDGSIDDTRKTVNSYSDRINLKYIFQEDQGFRAAAARNLGVRNAEGKVCLFFDSGILASNTTVNEHIYSHQSDIDDYAILGYIYGFDYWNIHKEKLLKVIDIHNIDSSINRLEEIGVLDLRENLFREIGIDLSKWPAPWAVFWSGHVSVKRKTINRIGGFDETYTTYGAEDQDFGLLLFSNGIKICLNRNAKSIHYPHEEKYKSKLTDSELEQWSFQKKLKIHMKYNLPETELWLKTPSLQLNQMLLRNKV